MKGAERRGASRRACLKLLAAAGGVAAGAGGASAVGKLGPAPKGTFRVLTPEEARLVESVAEQIIPTDKDPGAREAGVVFFIDKQLAGPYARFAEQYRVGLDCLQKTCLAAHQKRFEELSWSEQTRMLQSLESGKVPKDIWKEPNPKAFFNLIRDHSMQGFYGSPRHGGNRNYASYKMMGLEYPRLIGQNRYAK